MMLNPEAYQRVLDKWLKHTKTPIYQYKIINTYPHDPHAFTEGLIYDNGYLYESDGLYGQSSLRKIAFPSGKMLKQYRLSPHYFAEGLTAIGNHLYQLTYKEKTGLVYDKSTFALKNRFHYLSEGWGITTDGKQLIMSNGSSQLLFLNKDTFKITRTLAVHNEDQPIYFLNELEYIHGKIYANIWPTHYIAIISVENGEVNAWIDIRALNTKCFNSDCAANGIAYDEKNQTVLVTGKYWKRLYAIQLIP